jgi:hypothetical protein
MLLKASVIFGVSSLLNLSNSTIYRYIRLILVHVLGPWNLVLFGGLGAYVGSNNERWQKALLEDLNERRVAKGFPPLLREEVGWTSFMGSRYDGKTNSVIEDGKRDR